MIKSGGFGHGAAVLAREFIKNDITHFAVSDIDEALELRQHDINSSILVLYPIPQEYVGEVVANSLTVSVSSFDFVKALSREALKQEKIVNVHVKVDTGMGRFGLQPQQVINFLQETSRLPGIKIEGIYSHLSSTFSDDIKSNQYTALQIKIFNRLLDQLRKNKILPAVVHLGSSTSLIGFPEEVTGGYFNAIRIGTLFLGFEERPGTWHDHTVPICELQTKVLAVKKIAKGAFVSYDRQYQAQSEITIAILPIGYADGLHRDLGNLGEVYIQGKKCLMIGKITIGNTIVNVTNIKSVKEGSPVGLFGEENSAYNQGKKIRRGTWEILLPLLQRCRTITYSG